MVQTDWHVQYHPERLHCGLEGIWPSCYHLFPINNWASCRWREQSGTDTWQKYPASWLLQSCPKKCEQLPRLSRTIGFIIVPEPFDVPSSFRKQIHKLMKQVEPLPLQGYGTVWRLMWYTATKFLRWYNDIFLWSRRHLLLQYRKKNLACRGLVLSGMQELPVPFLPKEILRG